MGEGKTGKGESEGSGENSLEVFYTKVYKNWGKDLRDEKLK
jgi:hypothetical protein